VRASAVGRTVVDRLLSAPPSRVDEQVAAVMFAVTFVAGSLVVFVARRVRAFIP
jgi:hypothetical protein